MRGIILTSAVLIFFIFLIFNIIKTTIFKIVKLHHLITVRSCAYWFHQEATSDGLN